jgi:argonaute-like protein implicated in RNA metabolism and viral defense
MMGVLAKTGSAPFALTEPLEFAQLVVGLDIVRERLTRGDRLAIMTRIYRRDGLFMQYFLEFTELEHDEPIPFSILQRVFPILFFNGKKVILHHAGTFPGDVRQMVPILARELNATFYPVEILQRQVPRLYGLGKQVIQAPWGSTFRVSDTEAFVVTADPGSDRTAQPLQIRIASDAEVPELTIEQAVYSVLAWTLLHYGSQGAAMLPVTVQHAADLAEWLGRGMLPQKPQGDVPFWL